jgi:hypothetical protein
MLPGHWVWLISTVTSLAVAAVMQVRLRGSSMSPEREGLATR